MSLRTGAGIVQALKSKGHSVQGFDVKPGRDLLALPWNDAPDLVFLALHGKWGEDGGVQGFLDTMGVPYTGSSACSSALCFHKGLTKQILRAAGVPVPESFDVSGRESFESLLVANPDLARRRLFIKPAREGSTVGIQRFFGDGVEKLKSAMELAFGYDKEVLLEEWILGREVTVPVWYGKALPLVEIRPLSEFFDYESKYTKGKTEYLCPAPLPAEMTRQIQVYAERAFRALECDDYGRLDVMIHPERGPFFLEMNTLPGMTETSLVPKSAAAAGVNYAEFVHRVALQAHARWKSSQRSL